jgi:hypothetical protein
MKELLPAIGMFITWVTCCLLLFYQWKWLRRKTNKEILDQWDITMQQRRRAGCFEERAKLAENMVDKLLNQVDRYRELSAKAKLLVDNMDPMVETVAEMKKKSVELLVTIDRLNQVAYVERYEQKK